MTFLLIYLGITLGVGVYSSQDCSKTKRVISKGECRAISYGSAVAWPVTLPLAAVEKVKRRKNKRKDKK